MKETGILRRIDELGRIVVPKEIRKKLKIREGDNLDIFVSEDNVILKKYSPLNDLEAILSVLLDAYKKIYNVSIVVADLTKIIASTKAEIKVDEKQKEMIEALKEKTMLEKLKEKQYKTFLKDIEMSERKELDEIGLIRSVK
jgi:stage V sporulation protein T